MSGSKEKNIVYQNVDRDYVYDNKNEKNQIDEENECWASDSGSSSGSYYSNSSG